MRLLDVQLGIIHVTHCESLDHVTFFEFVVIGCYRTTEARKIRTLSQLSVEA